MRVRKYRRCFGGVGNAEEEPVVPSLDPHSLCGIHVSECRWVRHMKKSRTKKCVHADGSGEGVDKWVSYARCECCGLRPHRHTKNTNTSPHNIKVHP